MLYTPNEKNVDFKEGRVILIDKPLEWTSFDVVNKIRYTLKRHFDLPKKFKVGHAGTLDPLATGLLIVCTGKLTKQIEGFQAQEKEYVTTIKLGATTPSFDRETEEDATFPTEHIDLKLVEDTLAKFIGPQDQMPPLFSAKKVGGQKAYLAARKGKEIELKPNQIVITDITLEKFELPYLTIRIQCSKGTYIRSLGRDIGKELGSGGYLHALRRTASGDFKVDNALDILEFEKNIENLQLF